MAGLRDASDNTMFLKSFVILYTYICVCYNHETAVHPFVKNILNVYVSDIKNLCVKGRWYYLKNFFVIFMTVLYIEMWNYENYIHSSENSLKKGAHNISLHKQLTHKSFHNTICLKHLGLYWSYNFCVRCTMYYILRMNIACLTIIKRI